MIAGTLEVQMLANLARLSSDMQQAKTLVTGAMDKIGSAVGHAKAALGALGIGLGIGAFVGLIKGSIDAMDHLNDLSKTTDIAVEKLAGLSLAAKQTGSDLDGTAQSINKLSQNIGKDSEKFRALGITAKDPLEAFKQLADIFTQIEDPQLRAAVAAAALGKSWASAAPLLAEGGAKIQEMVDKGAKYAAITKEMSGASDDFNDKLAEMEAKTKGFQYALAFALLPHLSKAADVMMELRKNTDGGKASVEGLLVPVKLLASGFIFMGGAVAAASRFVVAHIAVLDRLAHFDLKGAWDEYKLGISEAKGMLDKTAAVVAELWKKNDEGAKKSIETTKVDQKTRDETSRKARQFVREDKTGAEDTDSAYRSLLKSLKEKLAATEELTEVDRLQLAIEAMSAKQLLSITPARKAELQDLARKIDLKKQDKVALDAYIKGMQMDMELEEEIAALLARRADKEGDAIKAQHEAIEQIQFETKAMTLNSAEREKAIALRALEKSGIDKTSAEYERIAVALRTAIEQRSALQEAVDAQSKATEEITEFWRQAARNMQDAMADFFFDAMQGKLDELGKNFVRTLDRMVANALAAHLADAIFGKNFGKGDMSGVGGLLGLGLDKLGLGEMAGRAPVSDAVGNLVGGEAGFARGTDYVPRTGLAIVHEGEWIGRDREGGRAQVPIVQNFTINTPDTNGVRLSKRQVMGEFAAAMGG